MVPELFGIIESDEVAAQFYLVSDTDTLYRWMSRMPAVGALTGLSASKSSIVEAMALRVMSLLRSPIAPGYRSEHEPAICCYALILSRAPGEIARRVLNTLDASAGPTQGWLRRLLDKCLQNVSNNTTTVEAYAPIESRIVSMWTPTSTTVVQPSAGTVNNTPFESLTEFWSSEDYRELKAAA